MERADYEKIVENLARHKSTEFIAAAKDLLDELQALMDKCACEPGEKYCVCYEKDDAPCCESDSQCICWSR